MKKLLLIICASLVLVCALFLFGCSDGYPSYPPYALTEFKKIDPVGQVPEEFKAIVENNLFSDVTVFDGVLLKPEFCSENKEEGTYVWRVKMMDTYGKELASYTCSSNNTHRISTLTATEDGGFLFVLGYMKGLSGGKVPSSQIIKCDRDGNLQFNTLIDGVTYTALSFCFERNGLFYLFGFQNEGSEPDNQYSYSDICMRALDQNGTVIKTSFIGGSGFDELNAVEETEDGFRLSLDSQSDDGDFTGSGSNGYPVDWVITVNDDLAITSKEKKTGRSLLDRRVGVKDGAFIYESDALFKNYDAGAPFALIEYSDFYIIVSDNITGIYENTPPTISAIWYYYEAVYSAYDKNGNLLFRAAVDYSLNYDA